MQVGVKSSPDSFSAIAFILSKYRIVSSEFEEIMKLIDKEIKKTIPPIKNFTFFFFGVFVRFQDGKLRKDS